MLRSGNTSHAPAPRGHVPVQGESKSSQQTHTEPALSPRRYPPVLQFCYDIGDRWKKVTGVAFLVMVTAVALVLILTAPAALAYLIMQHTPVAARVGIGSGSTLLTTLLGLLIGGRYRNRPRDRVEELIVDPSNDDHANPGDNASTG